jgi:hypothetical protein
MRTMAVLALAACMVASAHAEKVDTPPAALRKEATHVIVGTVKAIYSRTTEDGNWRTTRYVAEVQVGDVEKGEGVSEGGLLYVRYWQVAKWLGKGAMPPGAGGHRGLPTEGQTLRIYLARNAYDGFTKENDDGGFNVLGANGFEAIPVPK